MRKGQVEWMGQNVIGLILVIVLVFIAIAILLWYVDLPIFFNF